MKVIGFSSGDEMNLHLPQSEVTKTEIKELMMVADNIVSAQSNKPVMGIIQDSLLSVHKMTQQDVFLTKQEIMNIMMKIKYTDYKLPIPAIYKPVPLWSGKQVMNLIIPKDLNFSKKVYIQNGYYYDGEMCKKTLGTSEKGLIHTLWLKYGPETTRLFMSNIQFIANYWILHHGFTVGISDTITSKKVQQNVRKTIQESEEKVRQLISVSKHSGNPEIFEKKINQVLNNAMAISGRIVQEAISKDNNINTMVSGGSKGSVINIAQIMGVVGQQNVNGGRITLGYEDRTLCHFEKDDMNPAPKGFVKNSYYKGLDPHEFFYHAMSGREGITDTAVKTADTGYIQRRLIKSMEDLKTEFDGSVRNSIGDILQFKYGDDGFNAVFLQRMSLHIPPLGSDSFQKYFMYDHMDLLELQFFQVHQEYFNTEFLSPVHLDYLNIQETYYIDKDVISYRDWYQCIQDITSLILEDGNTIHHEMKQSYVPIVLYIRYTLCSNQVINHYKISTYRFKQIIQKLKQNYTRAFIQQGEMVGTLAAQSLGEPTTQLTLNSFHFTGISAKNITLGVPRFKELINVLKNVKTPSMTIYTNGNNDKVVLELESCQLIDITIDTEMIDVEDIDDDISFITNDVHDIALKIILNKKKLIEHNLSLLDIMIPLFKQKLQAIASSDVYQKEQYIIVFIPNTSDDIMHDIDLIHNKVVKKLSIKGIPDVTKCYINENVIETDGSCLLKTLSIDDIDTTRTISNIPSEVLDVLGVEAARNVLIKEIKKVLEFDGGYINNRHFQVLVDTMTYKGSIMSITRHGINKNETGPLMRCSFEETMDVLTDASTYSEIDHIQGVSESITVGKLSSVGTGAIDIIIPIQEDDDDHETLTQYTELYYEDELFYV